MYASAAAEVMRLLSDDYLRPRTPWTPLAVAGAMVLDLLAAGRLRLDGETVFAPGPSQSGLVAQDGVVAWLSQLPPLNIEYAVIEVRKLTSPSMSGQLVQEEVARRVDEPDSFLRKGRSTWHVLRPNEREEIRKRMRASLTAGRTDDVQLLRIMAAIRGVRAEQFVLNRSPRAFHCEAGHVLYAAGGPAVMVSDGLETARMATERQMRIDELRAQQQAATSAAITASSMAAVNSAAISSIGG